MSLAPFVLQSGGLGAIERCLETRMDIGAIVFEISITPPFVPPPCAW